MQIGGDFKTSITDDKTNLLEGKEPAGSNGKVMDCDFEAVGATELGPVAAVDPGEHVREFVGEGDRGPLGWREPDLDTGRGGARARPCAGRATRSQPAAFLSPGGLVPHDSSHDNRQRHATSERERVRAYKTGLATPTSGDALPQILGPG